MCDLELTNANVFNPYFKKFILANLYIKDGQIYYIDYSLNDPYEAKMSLNLEGKFITPGLIDIHMHIESSMLTPEPFCDFLVNRGITTIVAEPHEIANVFGKEGIKELLNASKNSPIDMFFGIPSSVPSTNLELETPGGIINLETMKELLDEPNAICVGEIMNYTQIIKDNNSLEISEFLNYLKTKRKNFIIEGHCPKLIGKNLAKFLYLGIDGDHTEHSVEELKERYLSGMFVEIQGKMLRDDIIKFIKENKLFEHTALVTDDVMADTLCEKGHLDNIVKMAIKCGFSVEDAIYCSTFTPAKRMNLKDRGSLAPGKIADFIVFDDVTNFKIHSVYKNGKKVEYKAKNNSYKFPDKFYDSINLAKISPEIFELKSEKTSVRTKVLNVKDGTTQIQGVDRILGVVNGVVDKGELMLGSCFNRYSDLAPSFAYFTGDCIKSGAIATTWFHDHHNLFVLGENESDMALAVNSLIGCGGGMVAVKEGKILALLELKIAGILSEFDVKTTGEKLKKVREAFINLGYKHNNPIMSLGTLGLPCSPYFKLTDKGIVDVVNSKIIELFN